MSSRSGPEDVERRHFLALASATVAGAAVLGACSNHHRPAATGSSTTSTTAPSTTTTSATSSTERLGTDADLSTLRTLTSVELALVTAYDAMAAYDVLQTDAFKAARLFRDHHRQHAVSLQDLTVKAGGSPVSTQNPYLMTHDLQPSLQLLEGGTSQAAVRLASRLEQMLAATYATAAGTLSRAGMRHAVMVNGAVEARHATLWASQLSPDAPGWVTDAVIPLYGHPGEGDAALGADAYLSAS